MNPNTYLKTMWRNDFDDVVFVAMSFQDKFKKRFDEIIVPAVEGEKIEGRDLKAFRTDLSKRGESILTEISDGIAHSFLFLADVSTVDVWKYADKPARNENVLYEVGMALACRSSEEVLLIRDDNSPLIFDTSTVPHFAIDFDDKEHAILEIRKLLHDRAKERQIIHDARVMTSMTHLGPDDYGYLRGLGNLGRGRAGDLRTEVNCRMILPIPAATALANLLRLDLAVAHNSIDDNSLTYKLTDIGRAVNDRFETLVEQKTQREAAEESEPSVNESQ